MTDSAKPDSDSELPPDYESYITISEQPNFIELRRRYLRFAFPATAIFMAWYLLYIICNNWARDFMNTPVFGHVNVALIFGLLQFVSTFLIAGLYSRHARKSLDPLSTEIREEFEEMTGR